MTQKFLIPLSAGAWTIAILVLIIRALPKFL